MIDIFEKTYLEHVRNMRERFFQTGSLDGITGVRSDILACWEISHMNSQKISLDQQKKGRISDTEFQLALERSQDLLEVAEPYMRRLHSFLQADSFWVTLMDNNGVILRLMGSPEMLKIAESTDLVEYAGLEPTV